MGYKTTADGTEIIAAPERTLGQASFKRTDDGSEQMGINGTASGSTVVIWSGTGDAGGDWTVTNQGVEDVAALHSGVMGLDSTLTTIGQTTQFDNGSEIDVVGTYSEISFWMQPKAYPTGSFLQALWKKSGGTTNGAVLNIVDYVTNFDLDVWQKVTIPIADFGLTEDVQKLQFKYASNGGQQFWFDDIEFTQAGGGGPFTFQVAAPDALSKYHVSMLVLVISGPSAGWNNNTFANISSLTNGLLLRGRKISTAETLWSLNSKDNVDLFGRFHPQDDIEFADGTLLLGFMLRPDKASIIITDDIVVEVVVRDDLSTLSGARGYVHYGVEDVTP